MKAVIRLRLGVIWALVLAVAACGDSPSGPGERPPCTLVVPSCGARLAIGPGELLPYWGTHFLGVPDPNPSRALVILHGTNRNADDYFDTGVAAATAAGQLDRTVVIAPRFQTQDDGPKADEPYWSSSGWKRGNGSGGSLPTVSSYAAMDRVLEALVSAFPGVDTIVVAGHSAGGQFVHRYAAGTRVPAALGSVAVRFVVANPSTYLYPGPERVVANEIRVPDVGTCPTYDDWHYGLQQLNAYMSAKSTSRIVSDLLSRDVRILIGDADVGDHLLDTSCGADLQGLNRFDRGRTLIRYLDARFPGHRHLEMVVPGVGHSSRGMFTSEVGRAALFN